MKQISVVPASPEIAAILEKLGVQVTSVPDVAICDALVITNPNLDPRVLWDFASHERPIAALSRPAISHVCMTLFKLRPTLAWAEGEKAPEFEEIFWESCAADDFVTDRENRLITTRGETPAAIEKALTELANLA